MSGASACSARLHCSGRAACRAGHRGLGQRKEATKSHSTSPAWTCEVFCFPPSHPDKNTSLLNRSRKATSEIQSPLRRIAECGRWVFSARVEGCFTVIRSSEASIQRCQIVASGQKSCSRGTQTGPDEHLPQVQVQIASLLDSFCMLCPASLESDRPRMSC